MKPLPMLHHKNPTREREYLVESLSPLPRYQIRSLPVMGKYYDRKRVFFQMYSKHDKRLIDGFDRAKGLPANLCNSGKFLTNPYDIIYIWPNKEMIHERPERSTYSNRKQRHLHATGVV